LMAEHVCPFWAGYFLASRLRKLLQNPAKVVGPYIKPNMTVLDFGCAMGFFSLPMAEAVGPGGKVVCVDIQPKMLEVLKRRATRARLLDRIECHICQEDVIDLPECDTGFDFALAFAVVHEVSDPSRVLDELSLLVKPGAHLLLAEPAGHVTAAEMERTVTIAREQGFVVSQVPLIRWAHAVLLTRAMP
jgi:2-polyprenyl-3-methyl-5-hydroxy-6-metoxy-1,4-benzoquinol methylase